MKVIEQLVYINDTYEKIKAIEKRMRSEELMFQRASRKLILSDDSYEEDNDEEDSDPLLEEPHELSQ